MFMAGTETTSVALQWALVDIINHPDVLKKLREEISAVVGSCRLMEESDIPKLPYLLAVVKESLRLNPSLPLIMRKCKEDCKINGYDIIADSRMMINVYAVKCDPSTTSFKSFRTLASPYGPIMRITMGTSISSTAVAREVMKIHDLNFANRPQFGTADFDLYKDHSFFMAEYGMY
ncbi:hypothetical protein RJ639_015281 [Escallonia herrerae]|uniref:Cytochrome P450 n=1 Tax=Escallonia herrerae TaxID=1293975 RepID=A0AA89ALF2_9ASTE|nr:hypothetical protein RJ639_015281 [Escallonia herrerae]